MEKISSTKALRDYFGQKPGQSISEFAAELKQLTPQDRHELASECAKFFGKELAEESPK